MQPHRRGCLARTQFLTNASLLIVATLVTIVAQWDEFARKLAGISSGVIGIFTGVVDWFGAPVPMPRWLGTLLIFLLLANAAWISGRILKAKVEQKRTKFRDLWLFFKTDPEGGHRFVGNRQLEEARCGECMGAIISTDAGQRGRPVHFLKCEKGHYVGGDITHDEYLKKLDMQYQEMEREHAERKQKAEEAYQAILKDLDTGKITQEEFDAKLMEPAEEDEVIPFLRRSDEDLLVAYSAQDFYSRVVNDFEQKYAKQALEKIEVASP